jgi:hypothetical protein
VVFASGPRRPQQRQQSREIHRCAADGERQTYFDASPVSYANYANNGIGVLLATGTNDDLVDPKTQTALAVALRGALTARTSG